MKKIPGILPAIFAVLLVASCAKYNPDDEGGDNEGATGTVTDVDGNTYKTVKIGEQWWMAENLKTTKFNDGSDINQIIDNTAWENASSSAYCWFNNDMTKKSYGAYYNVHTVLTGNICPEGWRIPTYADVFDGLYAYCGYDGSKLRSETGWDDSYREDTGGNGTDDYGFNAFPYSRRDQDGGFSDIGLNAFFWQLYEVDGQRRFWNLHYGDNTVSLGVLWGNEGLSIRCIKD